MILQVKRGYQSRVDRAKKKIQIAIVKMLTCLNKWRRTLKIKFLWKKVSWKSILAYLLLLHVIKLTLSLTEKRRNISKKILISYRNICVSTACIMGLHWFSQTFTSRRTLNYFIGIFCIVCMTRNSHKRHSSLKRAQFSFHQALTVWMWYLSFVQGQLKQINVLMKLSKSQVHSHN